MPVRFWDRDVDQHDRSNPHRGPAAYGWDPEGAPDVEHARLQEDFNAVRDELATGEDIFDPEWPAPVRHPSRAVLQSLAASYPRRGMARPLSDVPAPGAEPSSLKASGASSFRNEQQPGVGRRAA